MNHSNSVPNKKSHPQKVDAFIVPESDIVYLEREFKQNHEDAASFEISDIPPVRQQVFPPPSHNDPLPTFEIFPDFSHDRSQQHFLVSPEPPRQTPPAPANEFRFPIVNDTPPGQPKPRSVTPVPGITAPPPLPPNYPLPDQNNIAASPPQKKSAPFFSSAFPEKSGAIDSLLIEIVCSEPLLSEDDLLIRLKKTAPDITKQSLKQALVRNGLETDYKRFRAYMAG